MKKFMALFLAVVLIAQTGFAASAQESASPVPSVQSETPTGTELQDEADATDTTEQQPEDSKDETTGETTETGQDGEDAAVGEVDGEQPGNPSEGTGAEEDGQAPPADQDQNQDQNQDQDQDQDQNQDQGQNQDQQQPSNAAGDGEGTEVGEPTEEEKAEADGTEALDASDALLEEEQALDALDLEAKAEDVITADMTQEEIDAVLANFSEVTVEAGNYSTTKNGKEYHKIVRLDNGQKANLSGDYTRLQIIVSSEGAAIDADNVTMNGQVVESKNQSAAIYLETGSLTLNGNLTIENYDYGLCLGYTSAGEEENAEFTLSEGSVMNITGCASVDGDNSYYGGGKDDPDNDQYWSWVDAQGDGTRASAVTTKGLGTTLINVNEGAALNCTDNDGAGIFSITVSNFTLNVEKNAQVHLDNNGQGLCMNTDYTSTCNVNLKEDSTFTCDSNSSNGITGQSKPYIINAAKGSQVSSSDNGAIGINNFYIVLDNSELTVSGNGSHGASNVALDAYSGSVVTCSNNAYIGLNITKFNEGKNSTNIEDSTLIAENNGGPGVRFYVAVTAEDTVEDTITELPEDAEVNITGSTVTALGNGIGEEIYGYAVNPGNSGYWADICASCTVNSKGNHITCDSAYSLYNIGKEKASSVLSVGEGDVLEFGLNGVEGKGDQTVDSGYVIYNDNASTCVGRTYVVNGSLNAYRLAMSGAEEFDSLNPSLKSQAQTRSVQITGSVYAAPINYFGTKLTMFKLSGEGDFTTYDPNENSSYTYAYTSDDEGSSYVWAPVAAVHYDATEGGLSITDGDTVQTGENLVNRDDGTWIGTAATSEGKGYEASDYTISGQSLSTLGAKLPAAEREGYNFAGWYMVDPDNADEAEKFAAEGNYKELYKLLTTKFDENTVVEETDSEITVYAKWSKHYGPDENPEGYNINITKTAEQLNENDETTVQLGIGSTEERNKVAVLFVLDYSTSVNVRNAAADMLKELASKDKTDVKVGVVNYWADADEGAWTDITSDTNVDDLLKVTQTSGTNYHAGLLSAQKLLESDEIEGYTTYLITISDGITYLWTDEATGETQSVWFQNIGNGANDIQNGNSVYDMKYHGREIPEDTFMDLVTGGEKTIEKYNTTITKAEAYADSVKPDPSDTDRYWAFAEDGIMDKTLTNNEIAIYKTASVYRELADSVDYAYAFKLDENHWDDYPYGYQLMDYLASVSDGGEITESTAKSTFDTIKNQILYAIERGTVKDIIGNDFDLTSVDSITLSVGGTEVAGVVDAANANVKNFGTEDENGVYPYSVEYVPGAAGEEQLIWTINVPVENANRLVLSYGLKLVNKSTTAGTYGQYDRDGSQGYDGIHTNVSAVLDYETTTGDTGSKNFPRPTVSYTVVDHPATINITKKVQNSSGAATNVNATFYAAVFTDPQFTNRFGDVVELKLNGTSQVTVSVTVEAPADGSSRSYYVTETDKNGNVITGGESFGYQIGIEGSMVTVSGSAPTGSVTITNKQIASGNQGGGSNGGGSTGGGSSSGSGSSSSQTVTSAQTGDNTNLLLPIAVVVIAAAALTVCLVVYRRKRS